MDIRTNGSQPVPQPLCASFESRLPLLSLGELDATDEAETREHVEGCAWCQTQLDQYDGLRLAMRRQFLADEPAQSRRALKSIMSADPRTLGESAAGTTRSSRQTPFEPPTVGRGWLNVTSAIAATLLLALLAGALLRWHIVSTGTAVQRLGVLTEFALPTADSEPRAIVAGHDGALWFAERGKIGRITPRGLITEFPLAAGVILNDLALGPGGAIWFTDGRGAIGRLNPQDGSVVEYPLPTHGANPVHIVAGRDGALWFSFTFGALDPQNAEIGRITPDGVISEITSLSDASPNLLGPVGLAVGPDGAIWFCAGSGSGKDVYGRITSTGVITLFPAPTFNGEPDTMTTGPDGALWFNDFDANGQGQIGRLTTHGAFTLFSVPTFANDLAPGPDGNVWFVSHNDRELGRITPHGVVTMFALPAGVVAFNLTTGPDNALWFADTAHNSIDRVQLTPGA